MKPGRISISLLLASALISCAARAESFQVRNTDAKPWSAILGTIGITQDSHREPGVMVIGQDAQIDAAALARHIEHNDISLDDSPVATAEVPAAFALLARRGADAWIGGMGTAPAYRRRGLGGRVTAAALEAARAHGCETVWPEPIGRAASSYASSRSSSGRNRARGTRAIAARTRSSTMPRAPS